MVISTQFRAHSRWDANPGKFTACKITRPKNFNEVTHLICNKYHADLVSVQLNDYAIVNSSQTYNDILVF